MPSETTIDRETHRIFTVYKWIFNEELIISPTQSDSVFTDRNK